MRGSTRTQSPYVLHTPSHASNRASQQRLGLTDVKTGPSWLKEQWFKEVYNNKNLVRCRVYTSIHVLIFCHVLALGLHVLSTSYLSLWMPTKTILLVSGPLCQYRNVSSAVCSRKWLHIIYVKYSQQLGFNSPETVETLQWHLQIDCEFGQWATRNTWKWWILNAAKLHARITTRFTSSGEGNQR